MLESLDVILPKICKLTLHVLCTLLLFFLRFSLSSNITPKLLTKSLGISKEQLSSIYVLMKHRKITCWCSIALPHNILAVKMAFLILLFGKKANYTSEIFGLSLLLILSIVCSAEFLHSKSLQHF